MKNLITLLLIAISSFAMQATNDASTENFGNRYDGNSYIFEEGGVEFSVFPDGQFDFVYIGRDRSNTNVSFNTPGVSISFNSGYDYDAYVQYDDYGAVIQIEDVPVFYDEYGRISQAGDVEIRYNNRRIVRVGGMRVYYDHYGAFDRYTGFVSIGYSRYVYRPWHVYYARPFFSNCVVYDYPYRNFYTPVRFAFSYHRNYYNRGFRNYNNCRRDFYRPGSRVHYKNGRSALNRDYNPQRRTSITSREGRGRRDYTRTTGRNSRNDVAATRSGRNETARSTTRSGRNETARNTSRSGRNETARNTSRSGRNETARNSTRSGRSETARNSGSREVSKNRTTTRPSTRSTTSRSESSGRNKATTKRTTTRNSSTTKRSTTERSSTGRKSSVKRSTPTKRNSTTTRSSRTSTRKSAPRSTQSSRKSNTSRSRGTAPKRGRGL